MTDDERKQRRDIGSDIRELIGEAVTLQVHPDRVGEAEEDTGRRGVERIVATKHDGDDGDPTPAGAHVLGKDADRAKRQLRPRKTRERSGDEHCHDAIADDIDAERPRRVWLFAYAAQPQPDWRQEQNNADQRGQRPHRQRQRRLAGERPAEHGHADKRRDRDLAEANHIGVAEGPADAEDDFAADTPSGLTPRGSCRCR